MAFYTFEVDLKQNIFSAIQEKAASSGDPLYGWAVDFGQEGAQFMQSIIFLSDFEVTSEQPFIDRGSARHDDVILKLEISANRPSRYAAEKTCSDAAEEIVRLLQQDPRESPMWLIEIEGESHPVNVITAIIESREYNTNPIEADFRCELTMTIMVRGHVDMRKP